MNYFDNKEILKTFYDKRKLVEHFDRDNAYLEKAFNEISKIWLENFNQIETVNYLMLAEAPLWGKDRKYIYNPEANFSQFFFKSDLSDILKMQIADKKEFIKTCNKIGLLVVDISPFPFNENDTEINYRDLSKKQYQELVSSTIPTFFEKHIKLVAKKKSANIKTFFRYARVKENFEDLISKTLIDHKIIKTKDEIGEISQNGGGIDKAKFMKIIK
jgi:hypothetical protein